MSSQPTYQFISHKIHFFKKTENGNFAMTEMDPLPEEIPNQNIINESNNQNNHIKKNEISNSNEQKSESNNNPNNETNKSTNNQMNNNNNNIYNNIINQNFSNFDSFITKNKYDLIIGIAMYAEELKRIDPTLEGISRNLPALANKAGISQDRILILIISDGRGKVNKEVFETFIGKNLETKEAQIDKYLKTEIFSHESYKDQKTNYLTSCLIKRERMIPFENNKAAMRSEMNILFSIKKENRGKLDSHYWLFEGFCRQINPEYIILLDTGTTPDKEGGLALASLILPMKNDLTIAGTCGEMELDNESNCNNLTLCAQFLEYKYAHVVDKNFESLFGFISVLPGAFSAYRWAALDNSTTLSEYFKTIGNDDADCAMANRYLAEDRIFCWVLFAMKGQENTLRFIPDAKAKTDAPDIFGEFMLQRRRWINGSNFAMYYVLGKYPEICETKHRVRQVFILLLYIYYVIQAVLGYFTLGTYYFVYYMICEKNFKKDSPISSIIMSTYLFIIIFTIIASLTMKPIRDPKNLERFKQRMTYCIMSLLLGLYNLFAFILGIYTIFSGGMNNPDKSNFSTAKEYYQAYKEYWGALALAIIGLCNFLLPLFFQPSMICIWITNFFQYLLFQPTYAIILNIFAVCNIDDVSWGNRDSNTHVSANNFKKYKLKFLASWLVTNFLIGWGFSYMVTNTQSILNGSDKKLINFYSILVAALTAFKLTGAMLGKFKFYVIDKWFRKIMQNKDGVEIRNNGANVNIDAKNSSGRIGNGVEDFGIAYASEQAGLQQDRGAEVRNFAYNYDNVQLNDIERGNVNQNNINNHYNNNNFNSVENQIEVNEIHYEENKDDVYHDINEQNPEVDENVREKIKAYENENINYKKTQIFSPYADEAKNNVD